MREREVIMTLLIDPRTKPRNRPPSKVKTSKVSIAQGIDFSDALCAKSTKFLYFRVQFL